MSVETQDKVDRERRQPQSWRVTLRALWRYQWAPDLWKQSFDESVIRGLLLIATMILALMIGFIMGGDIAWARSLALMSVGAFGWMDGVENLGWGDAAGLALGLAIKAALPLGLGLAMSKEAAPGAERQWAGAIREWVSQSVSAGIRAAMRLGPWMEKGLARHGGQIRQAGAAAVWAIGMMLGATLMLMTLIAWIGWGMQLISGLIWTLIFLGAKAGAWGISNEPFTLRDPMAGMAIGTMLCALVALLGGPLAWKLRELAGMSRATARQRAQEKWIKMSRAARAARGAIVAAPAWMLSRIGAVFGGALRSVKDKAIEQARESGDLARWEAIQLEEKSARGKASQSESKRL